MVNTKENINNYELIKTLASILLLFFRNFINLFFFRKNLKKNK